jgi:regulator of sigma E protease
MYIIIFIVSLAILILVHEFGHFIVAKLAGIRVDEFALGFPPRLWGRKWQGTLYSLNAIPFGGFVKIFGEDSHEGEIADVDKKTSFTHKSKWIQAAVLVAGIAMNLLFAWLLISILLFKTDGFLFAFADSARITFLITQETVVGLGSFLWHIVTFHADFSQVSGVVGIASVFSQATATGFSQVVFLVAIISINLAVINLIPFPALDGGRLLFVAIEAVIRRPIPPKVVAWANGIGFALLVLLMLVVTAHDILKLM